MKDNIIVDKSFNFSKKIVSLYRQLNERNEHIMSKQLMRSATSIGANVFEAQDAQSRNDFVAKLNISLKEATETKYWLKLLYETNYISKDEFSILFDDCCEIHRILSSIILSTKSDS
ncbi:MAG: four helix bundle protein [Eubacterium sp.]|nr:four helix bundle protein [Eubacterium sp.]